MSGDYRSVEIQQGPKPYADLNPEAAYWTQYKCVTHQQQPSSITSLCFSPVLPHDLAVTASAHVEVLDGHTLDPKYSVTKFRAQAYSGTYRRDGKLLAAGGEEPVVRVFDAHSRAELRLFRGHTSPVRAVRFSLDGSSVFSGAENGAFCAWDLATGESVARVGRAHKDHIRAAEADPASSGVWATASYDKTVKLWDLKSSSSSPKPIFELDHGAPVEAVVFFPNGNAVVSAGGNYVKIWDLLSGGHVLATLCNFQKTVTSVCLDTGCAGSGSRLLAGGADHLIKVFDVLSYGVTHTFSYHTTVLSLAVSPDSRSIAIGGADGDLSVLRKESSSSSSSLGADDYDGGLTTPGSVANIAAVADGAASEEPKQRGTLRYFLRGEIDTKAKATAGSANGVLSVAGANEKKVLKKYDKMLRHFKYRAALDAALETTNPAVVVSLLRELMHRGGLQIALSARDETTLEPLLVFLVNFCTIPQYCSLLSTVSMAVIDMYASSLGRSVRIDELFFKLQTRLHREIELQKQMLSLMGALDFIVACSELSDDVHTEMAPPTLSPLPLTATTTNTNSN